MPIAHRRPGLLHLVLPHPALDQASTLSPSSAASPHTPRKTSRLLPDSGLPHPRTSITSDRPRSSIDSWNSVDTNEIAWEWKDEELALLSRTLDNIPSHLMTPYVGVIPPPNVLDKLARNIASSRTALEWPHSIRATRVKLHELCRRKTVQKAIERHTPAPNQVTQNSPQAIPAPPVRRPLYRQSSMDFLPVKNEPTSVTRLSSRLQRSDRLLSHTPFHPYARPSGSRSPTPPPTAEILTRPRTRSITSSEASSTRPPTPRKLFRSSATPPPPQSLKRAPSFGAASVKSRAQFTRSSAPPETGSYSSDEEEKARQAQVKRPRTIARRVPSFLGAPLPTLAPSPEEEILDPLVTVPEDPVFAPTMRVAVRKSLPPPRRSTTRPAPPRQAPATPTPVTPAPAAITTPRTLRRIGTRNFPGASPAPIATPRPVAPAADVPSQTRRPSASRIATQPRRSDASSASVVVNAVPGIPDEERRRERRERRERRDQEKEMQPAPEGSRRVKKKTASGSSKENKPSVTSMRL
ncbi:hypothetical protein BDV93DRAFT_553735 [Ceratobasidium sp. AG-I]|nr:hypothetical protein BDV93DRAFT_553735 [Ceratobasidium sp. AG-I]